MTITLRVDADDLTWDELDALEEAADGKLSLRAMRGMVARFMVDAQGKPVAVDEAQRLLGKLKRSEIAGVIEQFAAAVRGGEGDIPPEPGGS